MCRSVTELILEWQALGEEECFTHLVKAVRPIIEATAKQWLQRQQRLNTVTIDEIVSEVLDHLRRLQPHPSKEQPVTPFRPEPDGNDVAGHRYVRWLARRRTQDVLRRERRRGRRLPTFTETGLEHQAVAALAEPFDTQPRQEHVDALRLAVESLEAVNLEVIKRLLHGQSQCEIAASLGVSEGTVSRRRANAIRQLKSLISSEPTRCSNSRRLCSAPACAPKDKCPLPFVGIQYAVRHDTETVVHRTYQWFMFGCCVEGDVTLQWLRNGVGKTTVQKTGTCNFFMPEAIADTFVWQPCRTTEFHKVLVPPEYFEEAAASEGLNISSRLRPVFGFTDPDIANTLLAMRRHKDEGDDLALECDGRQLVIRILEYLGCGKADWLRDESVFVGKEARRICEYIDANLHSRISLRQLAQAAELSLGHFNRKCRRSFGVTPSRLVTIRRIQHVVNQLGSTDEPLETIARSSGFCSPSHCTNSFRSILGMPPSRFRAEVVSRKPRPVISLQRVTCPP